MEDICQFLLFISHIMRLECDRIVSTNCDQFNLYDETIFIWHSGDSSNWIKEIRREWLIIQCRFMLYQQVLWWQFPVLTYTTQGLNTLFALCALILLVRTKPYKCKHIPWWSWKILTIRWQAEIAIVQTECVFTEFRHILCALRDNCKISYNLLSP